MWNENDVLSCYLNGRPASLYAMNTANLGMSSQLVVISTGDATESSGSICSGNGACFVQLWEDVSYLYTPAADTYLLHCLPAGAVYFGLFYRYICLFHHR